MMAWLTETSYDPDNEHNPTALAWALHDAWAEEDWEKFRNLLADELVYECPSIGRLEGAAAVVELYREGRRFPSMTGFDHRRTVADEDTAARTFTVYIEHTQRVAALDLLTLSQGRVSHWLSLAEAWPPSEP